MKSKENKASHLCNDGKRNGGKRAESWFQFTRQTQNISTALGNRIAPPLLPAPPREVPVNATS